MRRQRKYHVNNYLFFFYFYCSNISYNLNNNIVIDLEAEMYQLSHILTEQRNILSEVREENSNNDDIDNNDDEEGNVPTPNFFFFIEFIIHFILDVIHTENQKVIREIKDLLHGYTGNLDDKKFIHEGALIELDPDNYRPICRFHLFLFNDLLVMAKVKHDKYVPK